MSFRIDLENLFRGPLDLLLYLVRKHEMEIEDIPVALITSQYLEHLEVLEQLDVDAVGDFVEVASTLIEMKSRLVLPRVEEAVEEVEDPRSGLVQRLLEYKKFKDAASLLEEQAAQWQQRFPRMANDLPTRRVDLADQPIQEIELWDLVSAFGRVMRDNHTAQPSNITYDETPIHVYMTEIHQRLRENKRTAFTEMFQSGMHKSAMIGVFLAVLELVRHYSVRAEQPEAHGEIYIVAGEDLPEMIDASKADDYGASKTVETASEDEPAPDN